jgi:sugar-specific transcriptional regulator TrmB
MNLLAIQDCVDHFSLLGFTELEAAVYAYLVQHSPATGYRIAHDIGKPVANTYKAIEALQRKGAIMVDETGSRLCRAVPPNEVLDRVARTFEKNHREAARAISRLPLAANDDGVYRLTSQEQVFDRARRMLSEARSVALLDLFPEPFKVLAPEIEAAAARQVSVGVQAYEPAALTGVEVTVNISAGTARVAWEGSWLNCVIDGAEMLMAYLSHDGQTVYQAIWSQSPFLCWAYQSALAGEMLASRLQSAIAEQWDQSRIHETLARYGHFRAHESLRFRELVPPPGSP